MRFYDTGGEGDFTDNWSVHFGEVEGFIFVIDGTDRWKCVKTGSEVSWGKILKGLYFKRKRDS